MSRLRKLFDLTGLPPLILVDTADVSVDELEPIFISARSRHLPVVFLVVSRRFVRPRERTKSATERTVFLGRTLSTSEAERFAEAYGEQVPHQLAKLRDLARDANLQLATPFFFGLVAFGEDFVSLENYVGRRLGVATDVQKRVLVFISLAYQYAQRNVPSSFFATILGVPENRPVWLEKALSEPLRELLLREPGSKWRPAHFLISQEILEQILSGPAADRRVWKQALSSWAGQFIEALHRQRAPSKELRELLSRTFVLRDGRDMLGTEAAATRQFAQLLHDIPSNEGKLSVLNCLVDHFPEEPHFWGHLGRFYSLALGDHERALEEIDKGIAINDDDSVLHHIRGMALRGQVFARMQSTPDDETGEGQPLDRILPLVAEAETEFARAREIAQLDEHAYVSPIQMFIRVADFGMQVVGASSLAELPAGDQKVQELIDKAESLFDDLQRLRQGQTRSIYQERCGAGLDGLYGNYGVAIQRLTSLLGQTGIQGPPIRRQIVRAQLARRSRSWDSLGEEEVADILQLMERNMQEEPANDRNIWLWFQAARRSRGTSIEAAIEKLSYWRANQASVDAGFYLYVLHVLNALDGSSLAVSMARDLIRDCGRLGAGRHNVRHPIEWLGHGKGLRQLVHYSRLGDNWEAAFAQDDLVKSVDGQVARIDGPEAGQVELACGLKAFFVPRRGRDHPYDRGRHENELVMCYLGFSYSGLRAWNVYDKTEG